MKPRPETSSDPARRRGKSSTAGASESPRISSPPKASRAERAAERRQAIIDAASQAFDSGYLTVMYVVAVVLAVGALVTAVLLRNYGPGSQSSIYSSH